MCAQCLKDTGVDLKDKRGDLKLLMCVVRLHYDMYFTPSKQKVLQNKGWCMWSQYLKNNRGDLKLLMCVAWLRYDMYFTPSKQSVLKYKGWCVCA